MSVCAFVVEGKGFEVRQLVPKLVRWPNPDFLSVFSQSLLG